jgi:hypothetical protein
MEALIAILPLVHYFVLYYLIVTALAVFACLAIAITHHLQTH